MKTFILEWDPAISDYKDDDFRRDIGFLEFGDFSWSVREDDKARSGDNFYLVRCGGAPTGIVMKGFFTSDPYPGKSRSGKGQDFRHMDMRPTVMVCPEHPKGLLSTGALETVLPGFEWDGRHSIRELPRESRSLLDSLWEGYLAGFAEDDFDGILADRCRRPEAGIDDAALLATSAHLEQKDLDGYPAILHPLAVGLAGKTEEERICGFLHDVLEDTDWTPGAIRDKGFPEHVVDTLVLLTHRPGAPYMEYVRHIVESGDPTALAVKTNDLLNNLERGREGGHSHLVRKHSEALDFIRMATSAKNDYL